jgi:hypothetical protein
MSSRYGADPAGSGSTCVDSGFDRAYLAADNGGYQACVYFFIANKRYIGSFHHRVRGLDHCDKAKTFDHSKCFHICLAGQGPSYFQ